MKNYKVLAIVPCYNEEGVIVNLLEEFKQLTLGIDVLVIDDGSQDNTYALASQFAHTIRHPSNLGLSSVIKTGISYALDNGYDYAIQIDGDGQHIPSEIAKFLALLRETSPNLIVGNRFASARRYLSLNPRNWINFTISLEIVLCFGRWFGDSLSGMRMMDRHMMQLLRQRMGHEFLDTLILVYALKNNCSVRQIPVRMRKRKNGVSHVAGIKGIRYLCMLIYEIALMRFAKLPVSQ
jgi:glycosyltransferase involved in cell wall biosynthesis